MSLTGKRRKVNVQEQQPSSLLTSSVYRELKIKFLNKIKSNPTITEFKGTRKIPEVKINRDIISALNHITGEHIVTNPPRTMSMLQGFFKLCSGVIKRRPLSS
ncbi:hypothetical protein TCON_1349 [Astathelohania contejeani]|uniref:Uncharacterized protein n=1 Tax=Astathelohania contejeani TaxID=164912 RepID=A0ABQ7HZ27_9MICR|nr:hypothetical protein TCON_1349 [Thelohania contejeani]